MTGLTAIVVVVLVDLMARWLTPLHPLREVEDAVRDLRSKDPTVLAIGSSHARTFQALGQAVAKRTNNQQRILSVPVEYGKLHSYEWVFQHRLLPLLEEKDSSGKRKRPSLRHILLVTEWWDSIPTDSGGPAHNLPARAWVLSDFLADLFQHGLTPYNRNYLRQRWKRLFAASTLIQDRGQEHILGELRKKLRPLSPATRERIFRQKLQVWQAMIERSRAKLFQPMQMKALHRMLKLFRKKGFTVTILLYPRMPGTLTAKSKRTTLALYASRMKKICKAYHCKVIDLSYNTPVQDKHFAADFDHMTHEGNRLFTTWSLRGPLRYLLSPTRSSAPARGAKP